jgi:putative ABC transport system permease protein
MNLLKLAWRNIVANPLDVLLSLILFALGIGLISFLILLNTQIKEKFDRNLAGIDMVIGAKGSPLQMILCNMYHIDNPTGNITVKSAKPFLNPNHPLIEKAIPLSLGDSYQTFRIVGTDHRIIELYNGELAKGDKWEKTFEATIGSNVSKETGLKMGDLFQSSHGFVLDDNLSHDHVNFKVVGILAKSGTILDQLIFTDHSSVWEVHEHSSGDDHNHDHEYKDLLEYEDKEITSILVKFKNRTNFQSLNMPRNINQNTDLQAASPAIEMNRLYSMIGIGTDTLRTLAIIIALVSALSIFLSLLKSLKSRKYELSLMRVMGSSKSKIFSLIILEGILLSLMGYILGVIISHGSMEVLSGFLSDSYQYNFSGALFIKEDLWLLAVSIFIGFTAATVPALQATRTDINKVLSDS